MADLIDFFLRGALAWVMIWGLVAFVALWQDKLRAEDGRWRIPESRLHRYEALGGWWGSWVAQRIFRHKLLKKSYQQTFRRIALPWTLGVTVLLIAWAASAWMA